MFSMNSNNFIIIVINANVEWETEFAILHWANEQTIAYL